MTRLILALGVILGLTGSAFAQPTAILDSGSITAVSSGGGCSAAPAGCAVFLLPNAVISSLTLQVSGTFSATLAFEATSDNVTWFSMTGVKLADGSSASTTTGTGQFSFPNSGIIGLRVRATGFASGTATITAVRGYAVAWRLSPFFSTVFADSLVLDRTNQDVVLVRDAANILALKNGTTAQTFRVYQTTTGTVRTEINAAVAPVAAAASVAAGGTVNLNSDITHTRYQITISPAGGDCATAFNAAALTADCTIATLPAGMKLVGVYADVTAGFTCSGTCTGTKTIGAGVTAGGVTILAAGLNVAATGTFGLADADLGTAMVRAAAIQGGYVPSWSATSPVIVRFTSSIGNWGSGAATFVNAGTVKFTLITEQLK